MHTSHMSHALNLGTFRIWQFRHILAHFSSNRFSTFRHMSHLVIFESLIYEKHLELYRKCTIYHAISHLRPVCTLSWHKVSHFGFRKLSCMLNYIGRVEITCGTQSVPKSAHFTHIAFYMSKKVTYLARIPIFNQGHTFLWPFWTLWVKCAFT